MAGTSFTRRFGLAVSTWEISGCPFVGTRCVSRWQRGPAGLSGEGARPWPGTCQRPVAWTAELWGAPCFGVPCQGWEPAGRGKGLCRPSGSAGPGQLGLPTPRPPSPGLLRIQRPLLSPGGQGPDAAPGLHQAPSHRRPSSDGARVERSACYAGPDGRTLTRAHAQTWESGTVVTGPWARRVGPGVTQAGFPEGLRGGFKTGGWAVTVGGHCGTCTVHMGHEVSGAS